MKKLQISGYGDDLKINDCRIGDLTPQEHQNIELKHGGQNYSPLEDVIVSHVKDSSTLICRKPSQDNIAKFVEEMKKNGYVQKLIDKHNVNGKLSVADLA